MNSGISQTPPPQEDVCGSQDRLLAALSASRIGTWECRLEAAAGNGKTTLPAAGPLAVSADLLAILGLKQSEFDGRLQTLWERICPADRPALLKALKKALCNGTHAEREVRFSHPDRADGWLLVRGYRYSQRGGGPQWLLGTAMDITARKEAELHALQAQAELEDKLAERIRQLRATKEELDSFCYSVSHDLRAPLRSIRGFNEVLLERYASRLDARGLEFLRRACESSHAMDQLMDDLLRLSRIGRAELSRRPVDLSQLATAIAQQLQASAPQRRAVFQIAPGLRASGDERLLRNLLENLLGNAWKFTSTRPEARIEFGFAPAPLGAFFVRDNGIGFDPAYASRLFGLFQRLHSNREFPGTGVGLAIVQRIINRHGGRVWAEGAVQAGASFYFILSNDEPI